MKIQPVSTTLTSLNGVSLADLTKSRRDKNGNLQPLTSIPFSYSYEKLEKGDTIPADELPNEDGKRSYANGRRNSAARAKAQAAVLREYGIDAPTAANNDDVAIAQNVKMLMARGVSKDEAERRVRAMLGL